MIERLPQSAHRVAARRGRRNLLRMLGTGLLVFAGGGAAWAQRPAANAALLVALPDLKGSIFAESVVLVMRVPGEETIGVILNLRGDEAPPGLVLPEGSGRMAGIYRGGPLSPRAPFAIAETMAAVEGSLEVVGGVRFAAGVRNLRALLGAPEVGRSKVCLGYSGWAPGQLAQEIAAGYWDVRSVEARDLFDPDPASQWTRMTGAGRAI
jgi:putative transcriptional regulator